MRSITKIFITALFILILSGCRQKPNKTEQTGSIVQSKAANTAVRVKIHNFPNEYIVFTQDTIRDTIAPGKNGDFTFVAHLATPGYLKLNDGKNSLRVFLEPGYSLKIEYRYQKAFSSIKFDGNGAGANNYIKDKYLLMLDNALPLSQLYDNPVEIFRYLTDSLFVVNKMFFNEFVGEKKFPAVFKKTELASITYNRATKLVEYLNISRFAHMVDTVKYLAFLQSLSVNNPDLLDIYEYRSFLRAYINYYAGKKTNGVNAAPFEITMAKLQTIISRISNPKVKDYLLFTYLKEHIKYYGYKNSEPLFAVFKQYCKNKKHNTRLIGAFNDYVNLSKTKKAPNINMADANGGKASLQDFTGKYVYIDVWATWCLPCLKEAPFFEKLKQKHKNKNIEFISISIDRNKEDWLKHLTLSKNRHNQFLVLEIEPFLDTYMIKTIPHFLIIDDKGNLINNNANRPSDGKTQWLDTLPDKSVL